MRAPRSCFSNARGHFGDGFFEDVVAQDHADLVAVGEVLGQRERVGDAAFAFLVGVVQMLESEFLAVGEQAQKIARIAAAGDQQDILESPRPPASGSGSRSSACRRSAADVCW